MLLSEKKSKHTNTAIYTSLLSRIRDLLNLASRVSSFLFITFRST